MLKNYLRSTIIVLIQAILPIFAILLIIPWLFNHSSSLMQVQHQLTTMKPWFLIFHGVFYLAFILLWPKIIHRFQQQTELSSHQLNMAKSARWYLLATFILIDLLMLWR
ncbi:hypothetical protein [Legionella nagasakiensis]|uniref:hypothetical protein n=1 Tax=Legionella nagasakiensis TaxID=535290 RepID=UPI001056CF76|nr:hypothetical protein [Legionella nagasakiensis]